MKLIIEIPKAVYKTITADKYAIYDKMYYPIKNGIPLDENKGEWIFTDGQHVCSKCNLYNGIESDFCPNCGADMRK